MRERVTNCFLKKKKSHRNDVSVPRPGTLRAMLLQAGGGMGRGGSRAWAQYKATGLSVSAAYILVPLLRKNLSVALF